MHTATEVAQRLGCATQTVSRKARELGLGKKRGGMYFYTNREVVVLRNSIHDRPGRPSK